MFLSILKIYLNIYYNMILILTQKKNFFLKKIIPLLQAKKRKSY